jgi:hypothetical protein
MEHAKLDAMLLPSERKIFARLTTAQKVQDYLDSLPINFELSGETNMSPRLVIQKKTAHCLEGAVFAAAVFWYHDKRPLLMDFRTTPNDEDHVIAPFKENGLWGAISKTNHAILRWRDPIYRTVRELAMSYAHEYVEWNGRKSLVEYSRVLDMRRYRPEGWVIGMQNLDWLVDDLDSIHHFPIAPKKNLRNLRRASKVELSAMKIIQWKNPMKHRS